MIKRTKLGLKLKKARKDAGLSQKEVSSVLQLSDKTVSAYEVGRAEPSLDVLRAISRLVDQPLNYFIESEDTDEMDVVLQSKLTKIERELAEIKQLLLNR